ncbi:UNVERIFIED_CONTAM: hypothetical protein GTU68_004718 [Idotea baltica]|nr:hypothetical protein [Idotea baltica]
MRYTIALGGNVGCPEETFEQAIQLIAKVISPDIVRSSLYRTKPLIHPSAAVRQQAYLNTVIELESDLEPEEVLNKLFFVERSMGRVRENEQIPWGPRTLDLDIIAVDDLVVSTEMLSLPHPEMQNRDFVLLPMAELNPDWVHPVLKQDLLSLVEALEEHWIIERVPLDQGFSVNL